MLNWTMQRSPARRTARHVDPQNWDEVMAVNVTQLALIRAMNPYQASKAGRAVFITSGRHPGRAYAGPIRVEARSTSGSAPMRETSSTPVRVNLFNPGPTRTRMRLRYAGRGSDDAATRKMSPKKSWICACRISPRPANFTISCRKAFGIFAAGVTAGDLQRRRFRPA